VSVPTPAGPSADFVCRLAGDVSERRAYFALRREIFCLEQGLFDGDDRDAHDDGAYPIICLRDTRVVGVVRIWETASGDWWGGRLGVDADFRAAAVVGRRLVQTAVGTARAWGAHRFRATVQRANVAFFRRLRWRTLEEIELLHQPHHLMEADLTWYTPTTELRPIADRVREERHAA
jgi:putative N-acetyltransferase (TIGR04045 family)